ncbi:MAG: hypothetical protein Q9219_001046 [cf. Caloplaca sp. 3 TL-2023]
MTEQISQFWSPEARPSEQRQELQRLMLKYSEADSMLTEACSGFWGNEEGAICRVMEGMSKENSSRSGPRFDEPGNCGSPLPLREESNPLGPSDQAIRRWLTLTAEGGEAMQ